MVVTIDAVLVGAVVPFGRPGVLSGIAKQPRSGPVAVTMAGLAGDAQGDTRRHGGPDKAVHHYPMDHYDVWRREIDPAPPVLDAPGAFGENLSTLGLTEETVCAGDVFRAGTALLQVSQARQPCWKLNHRFAVADMARRVQAGGRTGWYYRVLGPGTIATGDPLGLVHRPHPDWPLARLLRALYVDTLDLDTLSGMAGLAVLPQAWRDLARRRLETRTVEDWTPRLAGPREAGPV